MRLYVIQRRETSMMRMERKDSEMDHRLRDSQTYSTSSEWVEVREGDKSRRRG